MHGKAKALGMIFLIFYSLFILFCLYLSFDRFYYLGTEDLRYHLVFEPIPFTFPQGRMFQLWLFEIGNFLAFIPFGIMLPLLFRLNFPKFLGLFLILITSIEIIQLITRLGVFDVNDITVNTLGAIVGYLAQTVMPKRKNATKNIFAIVVMAGIFAIITYFSISYFNCYTANNCPATIWSIDFVA